jgi:hypothetical protein
MVPHIIVLISPFTSATGVTSENDVLKDMTPSPLMETPMKRKMDSLEREQRRRAQYVEIRDGNDFCVFS